MSLAALHPQIVHFVIALLFVGVLFRCVSLTGRVPFAGPAARVLLLVGTGAAVLAVQSGTAAHGPVERVPGARAAVMEHEEWGERTRNIFLVVAALKWFPTTPDSRFLRFRVGLLRADALAATGMADSAKAQLQALAREFANNRAIEDRLGKIK